jgi:hypothetical protein
MWQSEYSFVIYNCVNIYFVYVYIRLSVLVKVEYYKPDIPCFPKQPNRFQDTWPGTVKANDPWEMGSNEASPPATPGSHLQLTVEKSKEAGVPGTSFQKEIM